VGNLRLTDGRCRPGHRQPSAGPGDRL